MNRQELDAALIEIGKPFADKRVNVFDVQVEEADGLLKLSGRVLQESNREALLRGLRDRFPNAQVDAGGVQVLRKAQPDYRMVATNLTSVHDGTSFLAEQVTQMVNGMQVEVLEEQKNWGFVRQMDGYLGWTYLPYLTASPASHPATHLVIAPVGLLHAAPDAASPLMTRVLGGTAVYAGGAQNDWMLVELAGGQKGYLPVSDLRDLNRLPKVPAAIREQIVADGFKLIGVPYLWGGCTAHGIDCSGLAQLLHRWAGITLPRDADMQCDAGTPVEPPFQPGDLLFFGEAGERRRITHVAISLGGWRILHSSRSRMGVHVDDVQQVDHLRESFLCAATHIGK